VGPGPGGHTPGRPEVGANRPGAGPREFGGHAAPGGHAQFASNGSGIQRRADGRVSDVHDVRRGIDVHHGLDGRVRSVHEFPDHSRIVAGRGGRGYVQHPYMYRGHEFGHRTYYFHGRPYDRFYGRWGWHGHYYDVYARSYYYPFGFYAYVWNPWPAPVVYAWAPVPWAPVYAYYYEPYPVYPAPAFWLADAVIAASLAAAYEAGHEAAEQGAFLVTPSPTKDLVAYSQGVIDVLFTPAQAAGGATALSTQVKEKVAAEIKLILAQEKAEAQANSSGQEVDPNAGNIGALFGDGRVHVLVSGGSVEAVATATNQECAITEGDVISVGALGEGDSTDAQVLAAKVGGKECPAGGATVSVAVSDLQDMYNHMREQVDESLAELQKKGGSGGLPALPRDAVGKGASAGFAAGAPPPDAQAGVQISAQYSDANAAEKDVSQNVAADASADQGGGGGGYGGGTARINIQPGVTTIEQVVAQLGQPSKIIDLGPRKIFIYPDVGKITFFGGRVISVQ
jgi:hypothetical protein